MDPSNVHPSELPSAELEAWELWGQRFDWAYPQTLAAAVYVANRWIKSEAFLKDQFYPLKDRWMKENLQYLQAFGVCAPLFTPPLYVAWFDVEGFRLCLHTRQRIVPAVWRAPNPKVRYGNGLSRDELQELKKRGFRNAAQLSLAIKGGMKAGSTPKYRNRRQQKNLDGLEKPQEIPINMVFPWICLPSSEGFPLSRLQTVSLTDGNDD
jgi:hypothetical protein